MAFDPSALSGLVKPLSNVIKEKGLPYAKRMYFTGKMKQYESAYPDTDSIPKYAYDKFAFVIQISFGVHAEQTIKQILRCTKNHSEFEAYLLELGGNYKYKPENSDEEDTFKSLIRDCVNTTYQEKNLEDWASLLKEHEKTVIEIDQHNEILSKQDETTNAISALHDDVKELKESQMAERKHEEPVLAEIVDQNKKYIDTYNEPLFLENDEYFKPEYRANSENKARLNSVFVLPELHYDGNNCNLEETLYNWRFNKGKDDDLIDAKIFLLYGKAGDGKTSLVSRILAKNILGEKCHAIALRNHLDTLAAENENKWELLKECFKKKSVREMLDDEEFSGKVLILDGLDEVCVLRQHFNGNTFIRGLMSDAPSDVKILITSRNGNYFEDVGSCSDVTTGTLQWTEEKVKEWCDAYKAVHSCRAEWCDELPDKLKDKEKKFRDALSTPIILYICCVRNIDISTENSIAGIYDEAFNKIGKRAFNEHPNFKEADRKQHEVNWQYTKELAFQMFLNGKLEEVVAVDGMNDFAKERTRTILKEKHETDAYDKIEPEFKKYFAVCPFVSKKGERGVEFAHKTVGEYFTAVKLYEDYFEGIFDGNANEDETDEKVWKAIFGAFRYDRIPEDIMRYLTDIIRKHEDDKWCERFFGCYYRGVEKQILWKLLHIETPYKVKYIFILEQGATAFCNLTWMLTKLYFKNDSTRAKTQRYQISLSYFFKQKQIIIYPFNGVNCSMWENLPVTGFKGVILAGAILHNTNLINAILVGANLTGAILESANLIGSSLSCANMSKCSLVNADLSHADLYKSDLRYCVMASKTTFKYIFSESFNHGIHRFCKYAKLYKTKLVNVKLMESDLPQYDEIFMRDKNCFIDPEVYATNEKGEYVLITDRIYNPETNRMEYPKDKPKGD